jgi:murein DD-endopeptidase MepM/ murein hydrolase activator NlpD
MKRLDIPAPKGTEIKATANGTVVEAGWKGKYGRMIKIQHSDVYSTLYAHCSELLVKVGDTVERGQVIALVGATGTALLILMCIMRYGKKIKLSIQKNLTRIY